MANRKPLVFVGGEIAQLPDGDTSTPTGTAGGVLSGEFPNPGFAEPMATQAELDAHAADTSNSHNVTKAQVGLGNVDNTSDVNKPVSTAQAAADVAATNAAKTYTDGLISSGIKFPNGSIAAPGIAFSSDPDTGLRNINQGVVSLVLNGFDRVVASATETEFRGYVRSVTANGGAIVGNRDASPSWFLGDLKEATGSGAGMVNWVYGNNPFYVYIDGTKRMEVASTGATVGGPIYSTNGIIKGGVSCYTQVELGSFTNHNLALVINGIPRATLDSAGNFSAEAAVKGARFLNGPPLGVSEGNARNHFVQYNAGSATIANGWIAAAFGDETGNRVVIGQADGTAIVGGHNGNLTAWRSLVFGGEQFSWTNNGLGSGNLMTLDSSANLSINGDLKLPNQKYFSSGSFGRFWGSAALAVGQAQFAGLYGPTITYNAKIVGGAWQSIGGGTATAMTMDEGIFSVSQSQPVGADGVPLTWTTSMLVTPSKAEFKGLVHADGGGVGWAPGGYQGAVLGRVGNDAFVSTHYDLSSLTLGAGVTQKNAITIYGHTHSSGNLIMAVVGGANRLQIQPAQSRFFNRVVASGGSGNNYTEASLTVDGGMTALTKPSIGFHQPGFYAGTLRMDDSTQFGFYQIDSTSPADLYLRNLRTTGQVLAGVGSSTAKAHIDSSTYGAGLTVGSIANTGSQVNIGIGYISAGRPFVGTNTGSNPLEFGTRAPTPILFVTDSAERMRLADTGEFLLGRTSVVSANVSLLTVAADGGNRFGLTVANKSAANTSFAVFVNNSDAAVGSINQSGSSVTYNTTSDHRLKTNVRPSDAKRFMQIKFCDFEWLDGRHDCGLIAHELQEIYPDLVSGKKDAVEIREIEIEPAVVEERLVSEAVPAVYDGDQIVSMGKDAVYETVVVTPAVTEMREFPVYQQVNYQGLIGRMGTVIQQQHRALETMMARVDELEKLVARVEALENKLNK